MNDFSVEDTKRDLELNIMRKITKMLGYNPTGMSDLLHILTHPEVLPMTEAYIAEVKKLDC